MNYEFDFRILSYWIAGIAVLCLILGVYLFDLPLSQDLSDAEEQEESLEIDMEFDAIIAGETENLRVLEDGSPVEGGYVYLDDSYIGQTGSDGYRSFRVPESEFLLEVENNGVEVEESFTPQEDREGEQEEDSEQEDEGTNEDESEEQDSEEETEQEEESEQEIVRNGIKLLSSPEAGQTNIVEVFEDDERVEGLEVLINGDSEGETDNKGQLQFVVPD